MALIFQLNDSWRLVPAKKYQYLWSLGSNCWLPRPKSKIFKYGQMRWKPVSRIKKKKTMKCTDCKQEKPDDHFYKRVKWQGGKHRWCQECMDYDRWVRRLLAVSNPKPRECYLYKATDRRLEVEHDHEQAAIDPLSSACHPCNLRQRRHSVAAH